MYSVAPMGHKVCILYIIPKIKDEEKYKSIDQIVIVTLKVTLKMFHPKTFTSGWIFWSLARFLQDPRLNLN